MENGSTRYRSPHPQLNVLKQRRSGYKIVQCVIEITKMEFLLDLPRNISPLKNSRRHSSRYDDYSTKDSVFSPPRRRHSSKSPNKPQRDDDDAEPMPNQRNANPILRTYS
uniref:Uncharacterized protein n=1 Tax=Salix viminalis TaxID=40686 RepID=A0A6N2N3X8_SALVM